MVNSKSKKIKDLINMVKYCKDNNLSISKAFIKFAKKYSYSVGSVRNFYYKIVKEGKNSSKLQRELGLDDRLFPIFVEEFSLSETRSLLRNILEGISQGKSCKQVILDMASGNEKLALRYQNKYRNLLKNNSELVYLVVEELKKEKGDCVNPYQKKVKNKKTQKKKISSKLESEYINKILKLERENSILKKAIKDVYYGKNVDRGSFQKHRLLNILN